MTAPGLYGYPDAAAARTILDLVFDAWSEDGIDDDQLNKALVDAGVAYGDFMVVVTGWALFVTASIIGQHDHHDTECPWSADNWRPTIVDHIAHRCDLYASLDEAGLLDPEDTDT